MIIVPLAAGVAFLLYKLVLPKIDPYALINAHQPGYNRDHITQLENVNIKHKRATGDVIDSENTQNGS